MSEREKQFNWCDVSDRKVIVVIKTAGIYGVGDRAEKAMILNGVEYVDVRNTRVCSCSLPNRTL